jgi:hypothetical protein
MTRYMLTFRAECVLSVDEDAPPRGEWGWYAPQALGDELTRAFAEGDDFPIRVVEVERWQRERET